MMYIVDVKLMSDNFCLTNTMTKELKPVVFEGILVLAIRYYNGEISEDALTEVLGEMTLAYGLGNIDIIFSDLHDDVIAYARRMCYDRRLKLKYNTKVIKGLMHKVIITMDLDATLAYYNHAPKDKPVRPVLGHVVNEEPTLEELEAVLTRQRREATVGRIKKLRFKETQLDLANERIKAKASKVNKDDNDII